MDTQREKKDSFGRTFHQTVQKPRIRELLDECIVGHYIKSDDSLVAECMFVWRISPQGQDYWQDLAEQQRPFTEADQTYLRTLIGEE